MPATSERYWPAVLATAIILATALIGGIVWYLTTMLPLAPRTFVTSLQRDWDSGGL